MYYNMNSYKTSNGRVDIINKTQGPDLSNLFAMYDKIPANQCATFREPTLGQWDETPLSKAYFSKEIGNLKSFEYYPRGFFGVDKIGRPIFVERNGSIEVEKLLNLVQEDELW